MRPYLGYYLTSKITSNCDKPNCESRTVASSTCPLIESCSSKEEFSTKVENWFNDVLVSSCMRSVPETEDYEFTEVMSDG